MIGRIKGTLVEKTPPQLLIDVNGIGYEVDVPMSTFYHLPAIGKPVTLNVHMIVREDAQLLYGFGSFGERSLFRSLIKVTGVGARVALAILSGMNVEEFSVCIRHKDVATLTRLPGIGKKTAERLVVEMDDKLPGDSAVADSVNLGRALAEPGGERAQAVAALIALGYKPVEATRLIDKSGAVGDASGGAVEDIIRAALKQVAPA